MSIIPVYVVIIALLFGLRWAVYKLKGPLTPEQQRRLKEYQKNSRIW
jgi:hypothetical protein